jgi:G patch domain-containing protein 1
MSRLMASRFTSSTSTILPGSDGSTAGATLTVPAPKSKDPAVEAAKMNMYGQLTRTITDFYPTRLLCKRFNVKDPHPVPTDGEETKEVAATTLINAEKVQELKREARAVNVGTYDLAPIESHETTEIQPDRNEILEGERAGEEVFKSIFGDDSDDD